MQIKRANKQWITMEELKELVSKIENALIASVTMTEKDFANTNRVYTDDMNDFMQAYATDDNKEDIKEVFDSFSWHWFKGDEDEDPIEKCTEYMLDVLGY